MALDDRPLNSDRPDRTHETFDEDFTHALYNAACEPCDALLYGQSNMSANSTFEVIFKDVSRATITIPGDSPRSTLSKRPSVPSTGP